MRIDRGQAHTLEGVVAALLLLSSLVFALQVTTVTPLSASTSSQHIENQQRAIGTGVLTAATESDVLKPALLYWNESARRFHDVGVNGAYPRAPPNEFGTLLEEAFASHGIAYNVDIRYLVDRQGGTNTWEMVDQGYPSDNAVTVSRTVVLTDSDVLYNDRGNATARRLVDADYFASDVSPDTGLYNVFTVEVTIWRI